MSEKSMADTLRLTKTEQEELRKKAIEINKVLVSKGLQPVRDSELAHRILEKTISHVRVTKAGDIEIDL